MIYGTASGAVYWRDVDSRQDTMLFRMEEDEKIVFLDLIQTYNTAHTVIAIGEQGTIISYTKSDQEESGLEMSQFNVQSSIRSIDKIHDSKYMVATGTGKVSILDLTAGTNELSSIRMLQASKVQHLRILDKENRIFETVSQTDDGIEFSKIKYNHIPISIENDAEAMQQLIEDTLEELAQEEAMVKAMEAKEQVTGLKDVSLFNALRKMSGIER